MQGFFFIVLVVIPVMFLIVSIVGPLLAKSANDKARERKLALLKERPELAPQIWESIERQDLEYRAMMAAYQKAVSDGFDNAAARLQKSAERQQANRSKAFKLGLAVAGRFVK